MEPSETVALGEPVPGILRASLGVSVVTGASRLVGFVRFLVLGLAVGTTYLGNTYETANWIPNIVFELVAGGVLSAVFVPTFVGELRRGRRRADEVASAIANTFLIVCVPVVVLAALAARPVMSLLTVGVPDHIVRAREIEVGATFLYVFLPQIPLYVLAMVFTGVLHAHRRFIAPAAAPLCSSLVVIGTYLAFAALGAGADLGRASSLQRAILAGGTTAGVVVLAVSQLPSVVATGTRWRPVLMWRDPAVRRALRGGMAGVAYFALTEVALVATLVVANRVRGGVVAYNIASSFFDLPRALVGLPLGAVLLPALAERAAEGDDRAFAALWSRGVRLALLLGAPAAAGLAALGPLVARALLLHAPSQAAPDLVGRSVRALALGIPGYVLVEPLVRAFFARHDTRRPVLVNAVSTGLCVSALVVVSLLFRPQGARTLELVGGAIALGYTGAALFGAWALARHLGPWQAGEDVRFAGGVFLRAGAMGLATAVIVARLAVAPEVGAAVGMVAGVAFYALLAAGPLKEAIWWLRAR